MFTFLSHSFVMIKSERRQKKKSSAKTIQHIIDAGRIVLIIPALCCLLSILQEGMHTKQVNKKTLMVMLHRYKTNNDVRY